MQYVEHAPVPGLARAVRTVWTQTTGDREYVQRHLPTGGVEIHVPIGGPAWLLGPLTGPMVDVIGPRSTVVGLRFQPGAAPAASVALGELVDQRVRLAELRCTNGLEDGVAAAASPRHALDLLQRHVLRWLHESARPDARLTEMTRSLMPWRPAGMASIADRLGLSTSQLRRDCRRAVGIGPKALQRTLRFQGFLALAQANAYSVQRRDSGRLASLAPDVGYADQAHLSRECKRLTGLTPAALLGGDLDRCACGHDHTASFVPFLSARPRASLLHC